MVPNESSNAPIGWRRNLRQLGPFLMELVRRLRNLPHILPTDFRVPCDLRQSPKSVNLRAALARGLCTDGQRMHLAGQLRRKRGVNHPVALDTALPFEGLRHNIYPKVRLAARPVAGMALMQM